MKFSHIALTSRTDFPHKEEVLGHIVKTIEKAGAKVCVDAKQCDVPSLKSCESYFDLPEVDLVIVAGGDGTIIATAREMKDLSVPILGIHYGSLGFLTALEPDELEQGLPKLLSGEGEIDSRQRLCIKIDDNTVGHVLNEAVVSQGGISRVLKLQTTIDDEELTTFRADGLIIATPTGSTAYSLSAGGTIVHPHIADAVTILTPVNPHSFHQKPLIVPGDADIAVEVLTKDNAYREIHPVLTLDGQITQELKRGQKVHATASDSPVLFLRKKGDSFYKRIRERLNWGD